MEMGMVGLGKMGGNMVTRLLRKGHRLVTFDRSVEAVAATTAEGAAGATNLQEFVDLFQERPRVIWVMLPPGSPTSDTISALAQICSPGDIVIDGGNTNWKVALKDVEVLKAAGMHYLDSGTSGGIWGLENGYCLMVGGQTATYQLCLPLLKDLAPPTGGLVHTGPEGSGHFVKMVHNGIEYGMMQSYAEGFEIMKRSKLFPEMDLQQIAEAWREGSVVRSWLLDLISIGLSEDPSLASIRGYVEDTGEGRWTIEAAIEEDVPAPVITQALYARFQSRQEDTFGDKMLAMMRKQFGGHAVKTETAK
ncbi:MAG TPA: decarboxylating 6-phosphogluconate dehydrogenase [Candidatus Dormibacteraeota bacterium]|jgi:6-phosphogluconate dehydrogenase|nr:decarboxylating 6-phosphogluconate dehydrogenase [Candidatus Dormibacteraeota bacterium]